MTRVQLGPIDVVSLALVILGFFIVYQGNYFGLFFVALGIIKYFSGW